MGPAFFRSYCCCDNQNIQAGEGRDEGRMVTAGGTNLVRSRPAFSNDGKKLLVCTGNSVSVYSVATGMLVAELVGHRGLVTTVIAVPVSGPVIKIICQCWTASLDATLRLWDFNSATLLQTVQVARPVVSLVIPDILSPSMHNDAKKHDLYAFLSVEWKERHHGQLDNWGGRVIMHNLTKMKEVNGHLKVTHKPELLVVSPSGRFVGVPDGHTIHIWKSPVENIENVKEVKTMRLHHTKGFSTLAFHPNDTIVAAGDVTGRILIWRGVGRQTFTSEKNVENGGRSIEMSGMRSHDDAVSLTTWHWHQSECEVKLLSFSSDGAYLYSGAKEGVLVIWQLETGKKQFFPRLGGPLLFLAHSPEPSLLSISCADNKILLVNLSTMTTEKSLDGIKPPFSLPENLRCLSNIGAAVHYKAGMLVLPAENHSVQFYDVYYDRPVSEVKVSERNYIPANDISVFVTLVTLSADGSVMGTVEMKVPEGGVGGRFSLKFWEAKARNGHFSLSTVIDEPHSDAGISALVFHPSKNMAVSCSYGGNFKVWVEHEKVPSKQEFGQGCGWRCRSVGSYKQKAMLCAGFSADGSLLAVGAGDLITFWNPETNSLVSVIGESLYLTSISALSFISKSHHLVSVAKGSNPRFSIWNLSTLCVWWSYNLSVEALAIDPDRPNFAVLVPIPVDSSHKLKSEEDAIIVLFSVEDPIPIATWAVRKGTGGTLMFIQQSALLLEETVSDKTKVPENRLVFLNGDHEYVVFNPYNGNDDEAHATPIIRFTSVKEQGPSGYETMFGKIPDQERNVDKPSENMANLNGICTGTSQPWNTIFSGPSHVLPSLSRLGPAFLESLLEKRISQAS